MNGIEFFQQGENVLYKTDDDDPKVMVKGDRWIVKLVMSLLKERYPKALACLEKEYEGLRGDVWNYEFRMVRRFVKCNFGRIDPIMDLDGVGGIHFEYVSCPLRGECRADAEDARTAQSAASGQRSETVSVPDVPTAEQKSAKQWHKTLTTLCTIFGAIFLAALLLIGYPWMSMMF